MLKRDVSSIMLPLSEYAVVAPDATLAEAIDVLHKTQEGPAAHRHPHRAVLVRDQSGTIVGKLGHLDFLRVLLAERMALSQPDILERAGVSDDMKQSSAGVFELMGEAVVDVRLRARSVRVIDVCTPATASISIHATLLEATRAFLTHHSLSLLVSDEGRTVGILRLADLYDELARQVRQGECERD